MNAGGSAAAAAVFVWLGMVLAISFLEAPLKFRAPGVTLPIGLGIGRLVFRALNGCEAVLAAVVVVAMVVAPPSTAAIVAFAAASAALIIQLAAVRPALVRRSNTVLAGGSGGAVRSRSRVHYAYVVLEAVKVIALLTTGILLLTS
ncbi:hypothetical protein [[Mycobacterium] burgundiense]|uniref:Transmembrane protein n=1 Tax=[Mycobacterium] burgundiense TaxID=3064286 RepID=A0ABM9LYX8_9MYCO|nr:hypothetical protein [Mycolicibacterium sp. MU0053]CAJ1507116.1 hypothetical protein MU0053_003403 [Mycolicibacterium sp. MU0053]